MTLLTKLKSYPKNIKLALLIRHGDRDSIPEGEFGHDVPLNQMGTIKARAFGESLQEKNITRIFTSPIFRCVQTAKLIEAGYGRDLDIIETKSLGDPGLHIAEESIAGDFLMEHGFQEVLKRFIAGFSVPGFSNAEKLKTNIIGFLNKNTKEKGISIYISHDILIAMVRFCLDGTVYDTENWVNYLEGLTYEVE